MKEEVKILKMFKTVEEVEKEIRKIYELRNEKFEEVLKEISNQKEYLIFLKKVLERIEENGLENTIEFYKKKFLNLKKKKKQTTKKVENKIIEELSKLDENNLLKKPPIMREKNLRSSFLRELPLDKRMLMKKEFSPTYENESKSNGMINKISSILPQLSQSSCEVGVEEVCEKLPFSGPLEKKMICFLIAKIVCNPLKKLKNL